MIALNMERGNGAPGRIISTSGLEAQQLSFLCSGSDSPQVSSLATDHHGHILQTELCLDRRKIR